MEFSFVWFSMVFRGRIFLCSPGFPGSHSVHHGSIKIRDPPSSASQVTGFKACVTMPGKIERKVWSILGDVNGSAYKQKEPQEQSVPLKFFNIFNRI